MQPEELSRALWTTGDLFETDVHAIIRCGFGAPRFRLAYMPCRNRGEIPRLILEEAECAYELEVIGFKCWSEKMKALTPHGKLPCLWNFDGVGNHLSQETTITRFLAQRVGLAGRTIIEQAAVDELYTLLMCTLRNNGVSHSGEHYSVAALKALADDPTALAREPRMRYSEMFRQNSHSCAARSLAALGVFEEKLGESGTRFLVGTHSPTYADLALFHVLWDLAEPDNVPDFAQCFDLPRLGEFLTAMASRPQISRYLQSAGRMPRYKRDSSGASLYTYCEGRFSPKPEGL